MIVHHFESKPSVLNRFIAEIRDIDIQKDPMRFRRNIERVGEILCYELSKTLNYDTKTVQTPFGIKEIALPIDELVLCSVLRAGLPLHQGFPAPFPVPDPLQRR
jgi:uracil phosphoribosyltransferase